MKTKLPLLAIIAVLAMGMMAMGFAQGPTAEIEVVAFSPQELHDMGWHTPPSTGLMTVGNEELVYLAGMEASGEEVTTYAWSLSSVPSGSAVALDSTATQMTTFRPDVVGQFVVQLSITTASGSADTTVTITSAEYVGVGHVDTLIADASKGNCSPCHTTKTEAWAVSEQHSTMFKRGIEGIASSHYGESCIECHTLGYDTTANNGGFDDVAADLGWTFPAHPQAGEWDSLSINYPALAELANIQCENCHGPAGQHATSLSPDVVSVSLDEGVCGRCHEEAPYHRNNQQWKESPHAFDPMTAAHGAPTRSYCQPCHSGTGFVEAFPGVGGGVGNNPTFDANDPANVSCAVCHEPHEAGLRADGDVELTNRVVIDYGGAGKLCMQCHHSRRDAEMYVQEYHDHFGPHPNPQADMLAGTNAITFGMPVPSSNHKGAVDNSCVTCHMAATPASGQPGRDKIGEHTWTMHYDGGTPEDPSDDVDLVSGCQSCHGPITSFADIQAKMDYDQDASVESVQAEISGMLEKIGMLLPPMGDPSVNVIPEDYDPTLEGLTPDEVAQRELYLKAAYNYFFVEEDGSHGVHNFQYAVNLLKLTHEALSTGSLGAGTIMSITDVPNDQGKQVRLVWNRFSGDGVGDNPIQDYAMWRKVEMATRESNNTNIFASLEEVPSNLSSIGDDDYVLVDGMLYDFVGTVPAAGKEMYSAIAPTLFDSTKTDGMHWSYFIVSGHTAVPSVYVQSEPDSGYSVDNLAPHAPMNMAGQVVEGAVEVSWAEPVDEDFNYFAVYRSTSSGFDPTGMEPIATVTANSFTDGDVEAGTDYYYRVSAFDFAGNEGEFSEELPVAYTSISDGNAGIPEDFVLQQNFPNPFNPTTQIRFGLPQQEEVSLVIYDVLGKPIRTLISGSINAGYHEVVWDGRTERGDFAGTGIYIYRLQSNSKNITKKMLLVK